jgi:hypothetical protein
VIIYYVASFCVRSLPYTIEIIGSVYGSKWRAIPGSTVPSTVAGLLLVVSGFYVRSTIVVKANAINLPLAFCITSTKQMFGWFEMVTFGPINTRLVSTILE